MKTTWEYIVEHATTTKGMTIKQRLQFHYFNPNGVVAEKNLLDEKVRELVEAKKVPENWFFTVGSLNDYHYNSMRKLLNKVQPRGWDVDYAISKQKENNEKATLKIKEIN